MKKLLKVLALALTVTLLVGCFASCGEKKVADYFDYEVESSREFTSFSEMTSFENYGTINVGGEFIVFTEARTSSIAGYYPMDYKLYHVPSATTIATVRGEAGYNPFGVVFENVAINTYNASTSGYVTVYYNGNEKRIDGATGVGERNTHFARIGDEIVRNVDGVVTFINDKYGVKEIDFDDYQNGYYMTYANNQVIVRDSDLNLVGTMEAPAEATCQAHMLGNGNVIMQYNIEVNENDFKYDLEYGGEKYLLKTLLFKVENCEVSELGTEYLIGNMVEMGFEEMFKDEVEEKLIRFAIVSKIENKRLVENYNKKTYAEIDVNGNISILEKVSPLQADAKVTVLNEERTIIPYADGTFALLNEENEVLLILAEMPYINDNYLITEDWIFDYNGNLVVDVEEDGYEIEEVFNKTVLLSKTTYYSSTYTAVNHYLVMGGSLVSVGATDDVLYASSEYGAFALVSEVRHEDYYGSSYYYDVTIEIYNETGSVLKTFSYSTNSSYDRITSGSIVYSSEDTIIVRLNRYSSYSGTYTEYYKLSK